MLRDTNLAVVVLLSITQHTKAALTCSQAGAQLTFGYPGYGNAEDPGLLPGGRTYCDANQGEEPFCDECASGCANIETTVRVVRAQKSLYEDLLVQWNLLEADVLNGCTQLQVTCGRPLEGGTWSQPVYPPFPGAPDTGTIEFSADIVQAYCDYCADNNWGLAFGRRRLLAAPERKAVKEDMVLSAEVMDSLDVSSRLAGCTLHNDVISSTPSLRRFARAVGRANGGTVVEFNIPGCTESKDELSQTLTGQRRLTLTQTTVKSLGRVVEGVLPIASSSELTEGFRRGGCQQFDLQQDLCDNLEVVALEVMNETANEVTVRALMRLPVGKTLVVAVIEPSS